MASPTKRRVLAPIDANTSMAASPSTPASKAAAGVDGKHLPPSQPASQPAAASPSSSAAAKHGRADEYVESSTTPPKKICLAAGGPSRQQTASLPPPPSSQPATSIHTHSHTSRVSLSPAASSVFDVSALVNTSQATNLTEPDLDSEPRASNAPPRTLTREQSRQRAEILKLRLGLARYKLRTGQVDVPLEQLRVVAVPPSTPSRQQQQQPSQQEPRARSRTPLPTEPRRSSELAGEWVRQQQRQQQQPRPLPERWAIWGPPSSSSSSHGGDIEVPRQSATAEMVSCSDSATSSRRSSASSDEELPQQPRQPPKQTQAEALPGTEDGMDVVEDSDVSDAERRQRKQTDDNNEDEDDDGGDNDDDLLPQLPQLRRLPSPTKNSALATPRGSRLLADDAHHHADRLTSSAMRGSAVSGLLSLARS